MRGRVRLVCSALPGLFLVRNDANSAAHVDKEGAAFNALDSSRDDFAFFLAVFVHN